MSHLKSPTWLMFFVGLLLCLISCLPQEDKKWEGQGPIQVVPTETVPIQPQWRGTFDLGEGLYASNDFAGARLNGLVFADDTLRALITPENTPINPSPWYAFQLWSETKRQVPLKLTYLDGYHHRYYPKLSVDREQWQPLDSSRYHPGPVDQGGDGQALPAYVVMDLTLGPDTLWVAAQELKTSADNAAWAGGLAQRPYVQLDTVGYSRQGRALPLLKIGTSDDQRMIFVLSRQHPPEVTGYLAMQAFVEAIAGESDLAARFRAQYNTYVVPMANPDGVDNGHWRHSAAGIDLNRDWRFVNQPEIAAIQAFMRAQAQRSGGKFYFAVDFHSTWQDIYYLNGLEQEGHAPGLVPAMIEQMAQAIPGLDPNVRPGPADSTYSTSSKYFYLEFNAEALTYEIGDNTPRDLLKRKGEVSAQKLMELLLGNS